MEFAPQFTLQDGISNEDLAALVVPSGALGSAAILGAYKNNVPIYSVKNPSQLNVGCRELELSGIIQFESYEECLQHLKGKYYE